MPQRHENSRQEAQIRAAAYGGGNGALTYLDTHDLKPKSLFNAAIGGAVSVGFMGAFGGGAAGIFIEEHNEKKNTQSRRNLESNTALQSGAVKYGLIGGIVGAVIGGISSVINAKIHNDWAEKMTKLAMEQQQQSAPQYDTQELSHLERAKISKENAAGMELG